ncbi:NAD-dependent epimerase/dehydratase family protein [Acidomonas methanolica]|uniref:NAD-dependent epimerase/dehydratase family protein n=1 Tax=Acidomonas methanolica TaxID=437 RepID=UPI00211A1817|nr:NAD(P)-dependent oxidoreductase [Acidomonas methanolica]MCQ9157220.1 NAD(P)-dependent oxidoreductase [Acidomonas methanolica]
MPSPSRGRHRIDKTLFLAGATGAIGSRLVPLLIAEKWRVVGTTRSAEKAARLRECGVEPVVVVDVFDAAALIDAVAATKPDIVVHQLTDLPPGLDPARMVEATARNARIRDEGTRNLVEAAVRAGVQHFIAQSVAFAYAEGPTPHTEEDALAIDAEGRAGISARGVASLETQVLSEPFVGAVLRYGRLYGPGTGFETPAGPAPLYVDAAANAALLALSHGAHGIYNFAEDDGAVSSEKAKRELNWSADWRRAP